jgi:opacity protein-like surface antigen
MVYITANDGKNIGEVKMKQFRKLSIISVMMAVFSTSVYAGVNWNDKQVNEVQNVVPIIEKSYSTSNSLDTNKQPSKFYVGLNYSNRSYHETIETTTQELHGGPMVTVGYNLNKNISLELNHARGTFVTINTVNTANTPTHDSRFAKSTSISALGHIKPSIGSKVSYFGRVGYEEVSIYKSDTGYLLGLGVDYSIYDNVKLRAEYQHPEIGDNFQTAGLMFTF